MNGLYSCIIAISMYSKIPMPNVEWTEERMRYVMCFFPLVGIVQGAALGLWLHLALDVLNLSVGAAALTGAAIPLQVTGGIHMDGFLDTMDAIHSYGDRSRKLEILKDPHLGAFAVISFGVYMMLYLGVFHEYLSLVLREDRGDRYFLYAVPCLVFVMERAFSGLSVVTFPQAKKKGLAAGFGGAAKKKADSLVLLLWMLICLGAGAAAVKMGCRGAGTAAGVLLMTHLAVFIWYYRMSVKQFGGVTGDLAGCFLQVCELAGLAAAAVLLKAGLMGGM